MDLPKRSKVIIFLLKQISLKFVCLPSFLPVLAGHVRPLLHPKLNGPDLLISATFLVFPLGPDSLSAIAHLNAASSPSRDDDVAQAPEEASDAADHQLDGVPQLLDEEGSAGGQTIEPNRGVAQRTIAGVEAVRV